MWRWRERWGRLGRGQGPDRRGPSGARLDPLGQGGAETLTAAGAEVHRGTLADMDSLRSGTAQSDGVIHTAFNHDVSKFAENSAEDRRAIEAIGAGLADADRPHILTSALPR